MTETARKTLVIGMGNPILSDDAIGLIVVREARKRVLNIVPDASVEFKELCAGAMDLMFEIEGWDDLIVVDAYLTCNTPPGRVRILKTCDLASEGVRAPSTHLLGLRGALQVGMDLGYHMPRLAGIVVVDVGEACLTFGEVLSPDVAAAIPAAVQAVCNLLSQLGTPAGLLAETRNAFGGEVSHA